MFIYDIINKTKFQLILRRVLVQYINKTPESPVPKNEHLKKSSSQNLSPIWNLFQQLKGSQIFCFRVKKLFLLVQEDSVGISWYRKGESVVVTQQNTPTSEGKGIQNTRVGRDENYRGETESLRTNSMSQVRSVVEVGFQQRSG